MTTASELGETSDPEELIPGKPESVSSDATVLQERADELDAVGKDLTRVDTGSWRGPASNAFQDAFSGEPSRWFRIATVLETGATALEDYSTTLGWAQARASEAIELWEKGERVTEEARAAYQAELTQAKAARAGGETDASESVAPFNDPGEKFRQEAKSLLARARKQLSEAGDTAAGALEKGFEAETAVFVLDDANFEGPNGDLSAKGPEVGINSEDGAFARLGTVQGSYHLFEASATASDEIGGLDFTRKLYVSLGYDAEFNAQIDDGGLSINAEEFFGLKVGGEATYGGDVARVGVEGELWAGAGTELGLDVGVEDGKLSFDGDVGVARGFGGKIGINFEVDVDEVSDTAAEETKEYWSKRYGWG